MSYEDLLARISREIPELAGALSAPRAVYVKSLRKTYITFESTLLVGEEQFLKLESLLRQVFPGRPLAVRVVSPVLRKPFLQDPMPYRQVLVDFLNRNYPAARGWMEQINWQIERNQLPSADPVEAAFREEEAVLTLVVPEEICLDFLQRRNVSPRLATAIREIFGARVRVELTVAGDREERLRRVQEERREAVTTVTREEMEKRYGTGVSEEKPAEKKAVRKAGEGTEKTSRSRKTTPKPAEVPVVGKPILGRPIADHPAEIRSLTSESGMVTIQGEVFRLETRELRGGETLLITFAVTDYTSSILCKAFLRYRSRFTRKGEDGTMPPITEEERQAVAEKVGRLKERMCVKLRGECQYDTYARELSVSIRDLMEAEKEEREDRAAEKRVELHMHTNMSTMDALTKAEDLIAQAAKWGHPAVAITDHGVLQSFRQRFPRQKRIKSS